MFSDAPPSRVEATISFTWSDSTDVNTLTSSGMIAPASVPHVMMADSFHQSEPSPRSGMSQRDTANVTPTDTNEVSHTSEVSGASKFILSTAPYRTLATASFKKYETPLVRIIMMRITKIQTSSCT